jgi:hypothetical protein
MMKSLLLAKIAGVAFAAIVTVGLLATVDHLAYEQHAVVQMAKNGGASAPATTAARNADGRRI